jgi:hypothetical protein
MSDREKRWFEEARKKKKNSMPVNAWYFFEVTGILTYDSRTEEMWLDVESLQGQWPFDPQESVVRVKCRCVERQGGPEEPKDSP